MPKPQPIEDWKVITPEILIIPVEHIRKTFDEGVWKCSQVTEKLCFADLHPSEEQAGSDEYRSSFGTYRSIIGLAAAQRFDRHFRLGTPPGIFNAYMQAMSAGILCEIGRLFNDLLQIGIAHSGTLKTHPAEWAKTHLSILINKNRHVARMWVKAVCDKQDYSKSAKTDEEMEEFIYWRSWRAPKLIYMQPSGSLPYDSLTAWNREDKDMTEKLLDGLSARFVQSLEFKFERIAGNAYVELAKTAGTSDDRRFALMAIEEALKSVPEDESPHPKVGAVVVKDGSVLSRAHRGENPKSHAEYTALDVKLSDDLIAGATVYTTLEPCTTRHHPKIPCAQRLIDRKVARVVIGMLDPNPDIRGRGDQLLSEAGIEIQLFPRDLRAQVEDMNREFIRSQKDRQPSAKMLTTDADRSSWPDVILECQWPSLLHESKIPGSHTVRKRPWMLRYRGPSAVYNVCVHPIDFGACEVNFLPFPVPTLTDTASVYPIICRKSNGEVISTHDLESLIHNPPPGCDVRQYAVDNHENEEEQIELEGFIVEVEIPVTISYDDKNGNQFMIKYLLHYNAYSEKGEMIRMGGIEKVAPK